MYHSVLSHVFQRRKFDPTNEKDLNEFRFFLKHNKWSNACPFYVEYPWLDVVSMCKDKLAKSI